MFDYISLKDPDLENEGAMLMLQGWRCQPGLESAVLIAPPFRALLAFEYLGFQVLPCEDGLMVALRVPGGAWQQFDGQQWGESAEPAWYACDRMREVLPRWMGAVQFAFKLSPRSLVAEVGVSFDVPGDLLAHLLDYGLPTLLCKKPFEGVETDAPPTRFVRQVVSSEAIAYPSEFDSRQVCQIRFVRPDLRIDVPLVKQGDVLVPEWEIPPGQPGWMTIDYAVPVVNFNASDSTQIEYVPCIGVKLLDPSAVYSIASTSNALYVGHPEGKTLWRNLIEQSVLEIQFNAIAREHADRDSIVRTLRSRLMRKGAIPARPWGMEIPIRLSGTVSYSGGVQVLETLKSATFNAKFTLVSGESSVLI